MSDEAPAKKFTIRKGFDKPPENDIPKARWIAQYPGARVYDETKVGNANKSGLYVFLYPYDWGPRSDGEPMKGRKLGIAPFIEDDKGVITWKGRQRAGKDAKGRPKLKWQFDLISISPLMGHRLADAIRAVGDGENITEEVAEKQIEQAVQKASNEELDRLLKGYV
jgi:hypothetical protein